MSYIQWQKHRLVVLLSSAAVLFVLGGFIWAYLTLRHVVLTGGTLLILHFNSIDGITNIGGLNKIVFIGVFGLLVTVMNFFIALEFDTRDRFFGKFIASATLVFGILLFIAFTAIMNANV